MMKWLTLLGALAAAVGAHLLPLPAGVEPVVEAIAVLIAARNTALTRPAPSDPARIWAWALVALLLTPSLAQAQGPALLAYTTFTANVTLTTTTETVIVSTPRRNAPRGDVEVLVWACAQLTTGAATTTVTPRIRRGTAITGTLVGEANAITVGAAAGSTETFCLLETEHVAQTAVEYSLTLEQASATGNGTALHGSIIVLAR